MCTACGRKNGKFSDAAGRSYETLAGGIIEWRTGTSSFRRRYRITTKTNLQFLTKIVLEIAGKCIIINIGMIRKSQDFMRERRS